jgi:hypothetical protein
MPPPTYEDVIIEKQNEGLPSYNDLFEISTDCAPSSASRNLTSSPSEKIYLAAEAIEIFFLTIESSIFRFFSNDLFIKTRIALLLFVTFYTSMLFFIQAVKGSYNILLKGENINMFFLWSFFIVILISKLVIFLYKMFRNTDSGIQFVFYTDEYTIRCVFWLQIFFFIDDILTIIANTEMFYVITIKN